MFTKCASALNNNIDLGQIAITTTTSNSRIDSNHAMVAGGHMFSIYLILTTIVNIPAGANVWVGNIPSQYRPLNGASGTSYTSQYAILGSLVGTSIVLRLVGTQTLGPNNQFGIMFNFPLLYPL